ncbi:hypothetical protein AAFF_G00073820 [Aldrovandia affinis]|uniref:Uncharacterized protein n=1 Tax=Aldrovandia affinis TaxID=143900 RepID=A0AAD7WE09_9TELE|nr:hypothetical protein AAFF_G00073820 [Aldrovandia affinis]
MAHRRGEGFGSSLHSSRWEAVDSGAERHSHESAESEGPLTDVREERRGQGSQRCPSPVPPSLPPSRRTSLPSAQTLQNRGARLRLLQNEQPQQRGPLSALATRNRTADRTSQRPPRHQGQQAKTTKLHRTKAKAGDWVRWISYSSTGV